MKIEKIAALPAKNQTKCAPCQLSFGRAIDEHKSWGARINPETKEGSFKMLTWNDVRGVSTVVYDENDNAHEIPLENRGRGIFEKTNIPPELVKPGSKYVYKITKNNGETETVKDPYSFKQEALSGCSTIYNQNEFDWQNDEIWANSPERITRTGAKSPREARIYALNPDSFTSKRTYDAVIPKLKEIKKEGFNAVEIMHVENTFKENWGYDGVDKFSPSNYLGGPDKLKSLVDAAHKEGLNVIFDVIPNHMGPDGNQLSKTGPYIKGADIFGDSFNFEGQNNEYVRDWMVNAMLNWAENYHVDGLRLDMTKFMGSDYTLQQIAAEMNYHYPDVFLIAEDGRTGIGVDYKGNFWNDGNEVHDKRVTSPLWGEDYGTGKSQQEHAEKIQRIINNQTGLARLGMDSEWDFNFYHNLDSAMYGAGNTNELIKAILNAQSSVKYVMSHDEIGNYEGTRKIAKLMVPKLMLNETVSLTSKDIERAKEYASIKNISFENAVQIVTFQKAQLVSEQLAIKLQTGKLDKYKINPETSPTEAAKIKQQLYNEVLAPLGISAGNNYTHKKIENAYKSSYNQCKGAQALTFLVPGPKMVFQGDEKADLTPFRFFREFESVPNEEYLYVEKGYPQGVSALNDSTMGKIKYSKEGSANNKAFLNLTKDLNRLNDENPALSRGYIDEKSIVNHPLSKVIGFLAKDKESGNEIFTVSNFGTATYCESKDNEYWITFPPGKWVEILNTDDEKYGGRSRALNTGEIIQGSGSSNCPMSIAGSATACFKRVD